MPLWCAELHERAHTLNAKSVVCRTPRTCTHAEREMSASHRAGESARNLGAPPPPGRTPELADLMPPSGTLVHNQQPPSSKVGHNLPKMLHSGRAFAQDLRHAGSMHSVSERAKDGGQKMAAGANKEGERRLQERAHRSDGALIRRLTSRQLGVRGGCRLFCPSGTGVRPRGLLGWRSWGRSAASGSQ